MPHDRPGNDDHPGRASTRANLKAIFTEVTNR
jgi:hypothetical protein